MRAVVQRVKQASVLQEGRATATIGPGLLVLLAVATADTPADGDYLAGKIAALRIFDDPSGKMNLSVKDVGGEVLVVSNFTLLGDCRRGRRPSFDKAAPPQEAEALYRRFVERLGIIGIPVATGTFQAAMEVHLVNDGPVTLVLESPHSS